MLANYLKLAWRNLLKSKGFSFINISGLAIGMAVAMMIGLWIYDELTFNHFHKNHDRLAQLWIHQQFNENIGSGQAMSIPVANALRTDFSADFKNVSLGSWNFEHLLTYGDKKILNEGMYAEPMLPGMLMLDMKTGSLENALKDPGAILLSETLAKTLFGDEDPMNKVIRVDQKADALVTGVFRDLPYNSTFFPVKFFLPWSLYLTQEPWIRNSQEQWGNHSFQIFAEMADNAGMAQVSGKIVNVEKDHNKDGNPQLFLHPMDKWHLYSNFKDGKNIGGRIQFVWLFGIIGVFVLLLACINFMNLSTARSEKRAKEVGVRKTVGSLRKHLVGQFLTESILVAALALILSVGLVRLALPWFNELADKQIKIPFTNPVFILLALGFALITGLLAGSYPAFYLSSFRPIKILKGVFRTGRWAALPRKILVVVQFTVSIVLIIGTMIVFNQIQYAKNRPVGYDREGLLQFNVSTGLYGKYDVLRDDLLKTGAVYEMSQSSSPTTGIWSNQIGFDWEGKDPNTLPLFGIVACSHDFGKSVGWEVLQGRDFSRDFATDTAAFILNEAAVELTGLDNIVGKTIRKNDKPYQVIGVVKDMVMQSPYNPTVPTIFSIDYEWASIFNVKLTPGVPVQDALKKVETVFKKLDPDAPFDYKFADDEYDAKFRSEERIGKLARVFAILAIFISCLGLFGLSAYVAEQRTKEIGIRKVLGASLTNLWAMLSKDFIGLVFISCFVAVPVAWYYLSGWLASYTYRIGLQWWVFVMAGVLAVAVTLFTVSFQSIRAALANPARSLRSE